MASDEEVDRQSTQIHEPSSYSYLAKDGYGCGQLNASGFIRDTATMTVSEFIKVMAATKHLTKQKKRDKLVELRRVLFDQLKLSHSELFERFIGGPATVFLLPRDPNIQLKHINEDIHAICCSIEEGEIVDHIKLQICGRLYNMVAGQVMPICLDQDVGAARIDNVLNVLKQQHESLCNISKSQNIQNQELVKLQEATTQLSSRLERIEKKNFINNSLTYSNAVKFDNKLNNSVSSSPFQMSKASVDTSQRTGRVVDGLGPSRVATKRTASAGDETGRTSREAGSPLAREASKRACVADESLRGRSRIVDTPGGIFREPTRRSLDPGKITAESSSKHRVHQPTTGNWQEVRNQSRKNKNQSKLLGKGGLDGGPRKPKYIVIGTKTIDGMRAASRHYTYYTGRWESSVTVDDLVKHLESLGVSVKNCESNTTKHDKFRSFKFVCDSNDSEKVMDPESWPRGVTLKRWREINKKEGKSLTSKSSEFTTPKSSVTITKATNNEIASGEAPEAPALAQNGHDSEMMQ